MTRMDANAFTRQELRLRKHHRRHALEYSIEHTNTSGAYKFIKGKDEVLERPTFHTSMSSHLV